MFFGRDDTYKELASQRRERKVFWSEGLSALKAQRWERAGCAQVTTRITWSRYRKGSQSETTGDLCAKLGDLNFKLYH